MDVNTQDPPAVANIQTRVINAGSKQRPFNLAVPEDQVVCRVVSLYGGQSLAIADSDATDTTFSDLRASFHKANPGFQGTILKVDILS